MSETNTDARERVEIDFDHRSAEYAANWQRISDDNLARCPVAHTEAHGGFWLLSDYETVATAARDDATFSSYHDPSHETPYGGVTIPPSIAPQIPIELDPPQFDPLRKLLNPVFSPAASKQWAPFIEQTTTACLDAIIERGSGDLVLDVGNPIPAILTMKILGLPTEQWPEFAEPAHELTYLAPGTDAYNAAAGKFMGLIGILGRVVGERSAAPQDDLISTLVQARIDGRPLDPQTVVAICTLIIFGGVDTTTSLLSNALVWLAENPSERARLAADPSLLPAATEEFLRYFAPQQMLARTTTRDVEVGGQQICAGERVMLSWAAANRDPAVFDRPGDVVLDRFPNRHTTFGLGIHRCLGSTLARLQISIILGQILTRMPDYAVVPGGAKPYPSIGVANGYIALPVTFTPGTRIEGASS